MLVFVFLSLDEDMSGKTKLNEILCEVNIDDMSLEKKDRTMNFSEVLQILDVIYKKKVTVIPFLKKFS